MDDRIRLAKAMGWRQTSKRVWLNPNGKRCTDYRLPDPFHDANDCEALIRFLNDAGAKVTIEWLVSHVEIEITFPPNGVLCVRADGQNWKKLLAELAVVWLEDRDMPRRPGESISVPIRGRY